MMKMINVREAEVVDLELEKIDEVKVLKVVKVVEVGEVVVVIHK